MDKIQKMTTAARDALYSAFDKFTGDNMTVCLVAKDGKIIGRIISKNRDACTAWVQVWGFPPAKGRATGGGYDKQTAAILKAMASLVEDDLLTTSEDKRDNLKKWVSLGEKATEGPNWRNVLEGAGYVVHNAI